MAVVETTSGKVQGVRRRGVFTFQGLPYAEPPLGALRFAAPRPPTPWRGVRQATHPAPAAPQVRAPIMRLFALSGAGLSEDCLALNIWTPALDNGKRPVLVWIHGGAFVFGSGGFALYNGAQLARAGDAVVVTLNYRLGALGFLQPGEAAAGRGFVGNCGLRDQVAALKWVQGNIGAFGGDPGRVTIFGESAGAMSVSTLLAVPEARGLFQRAIAQSGAAHNVTDAAHAERLRVLFLQHLGLGPQQVHKLRELPLAALLAAQTRTMAEAFFSVPGMAFQPAEETGWLPEQPLAAIAAGRGAPVPLLIGVNRDEWNFFLPADPRSRGMDEAALQRRLARALPAPAAAQAQALYKRHYPGVSPRRRWSAFQTDRIFRAPAELLTDAHARHAPCYNYYFTWSPPLLRGNLGAAHAVELPLVFGTWRHPIPRGLYLGARSISRRMQRHWLAFAQGGSPGWPRVSPANRFNNMLGPRDEHALGRFDQFRAFWSAHHHLHHLHHPAGR